jgi:hypothetical protein
MVASRVAAAVALTVERWTTKGSPSEDRRPGAGQPVYVGICSCGEATGLLWMGRNPPDAWTRPGHEKHTAQTMMLTGDSNRPLTKPRVERLRRAIYR